MGRILCPRLVPVANWRSFSGAFRLDYWPGGTEWVPVRSDEIDGDPLKSEPESRRIRAQPIVVVAPIDEERVGEDGVLVLSGATPAIPIQLTKVAA